MWPSPTSFIIRKHILNFVQHKTSRWRLTLYFNISINASFRGRTRGKRLFTFSLTSPPPFFLVWRLFTEAVCLSDPGLHQALHRSQLATETRQGSLRQRSPGEGGQGNSRVQHVQLTASSCLTSHSHGWNLQTSTGYKYIHLHFVNAYFNLGSSRGSNGSLCTPLTWVNLCGRGWMISLSMCVRWIPTVCAEHRGRIHHVVYTCFSPMKVIGRQIIFK